eukprot:4026074-Pyramimonas_sp.AAC.1
MKGRDGRDRRGGNEGAGGRSARGAQGKQETCRRTSDVGTYESSSSTMLFVAAEGRPPFRALKCPTGLTNPTRSRRKRSACEAARIG